MTNLEKRPQMPGNAASRELSRTAARCLARLPDLAGATILLGLSGGADSVALFHALLGLRAKFGFNLAAAHLNHCLRAQESDRDEAFVRQLCDRMRVGLSVERLQGLRHSSANLEERARAARYAFLTATADRIGARYIALAHQADDQAETVMMRLLRGTGITGLSAMAELGGRLVRPLLKVRRRVILAYLSEIGAAFVEDSSNRSLNYDRNRLRHRLLPMLERDYAPGLTERLVELGAEMRQIDDLLARMAADAMSRCLDEDGWLDLDGFRSLHPALGPVLMRRYIIRTIGSLSGFERSHIEAICGLAVDGPPNGRIVLPGGWLARRRYGKLLVVRERKHNDVAPAFEMPLALSGVTVVEPAQTIFESTLLTRASLTMPRDQTRAVFDLRALSSGLTVRNFKPGDRIAPLGLSGSRKVKDVFIEHKLATDQRRRFPIVTLEGRVAWLPGLVRSNLGLVTAETTQVVQLSASSGRCVQFNPRASVY